MRTKPVSGWVESTTAQAVTAVAEDLAGAMAHMSGLQHIDLLFVDLRLKDLVLGGFDVANQALRIQPGLRVLYTSGKPYTGEMAQHFVEGGQFIQKPYSTAQLELSVGELLQRSN